MLNIIIFGTGSSAVNFLSTIDKKKANIIAFADNDKKKHNTIFYRKSVISPEEILSLDYDYIFIASQFSYEIMLQLLELGIDYSRVIPTDVRKHSLLVQKELKTIRRKVEKKYYTYKGNKVKVAVLNYNYSNYNGYALYKYMPDYISDKYEVDLIEEKNIEKLKQYDVICSSLFEGIYDGNHINMEFWHGFPIKRIGVMDPINVNDDFLNYVDKSTKYTNLIFSYSQLYTTFFNSSFPSDISKYRITGMPRNDLLFEKGSLSKLEKIVGKPLKDYNITFYMPTWRRGKNPKRIDSSREWDELFGFNDEMTSEVTRMVEEDNLFLVVKLHPYEYNLYKNLEVFKHPQVHLLSDETLMLHKVHLYELLASSSFIITDYSSIFFDTLLLDIPVIFAPTDLKEYEENKGFLMDPYEHFTSGASVKSLEELKQEIKLLLSGRDEYVEERAMVKKLVFKYLDNKSSKRAWLEIDRYIEAKEVN